MNTLLKAIQSTLKADVKLSYLQGSIHIIPEGEDHDVLPDEDTFPMVGITDGTEDITHETGKHQVIIRLVRITAYSEVMVPERAIVGDDTVKGVIDILKDVQATLEYNLLGLSGAGYTMALSVSVTASNVVPLGEILAVKKTIIFKYRYLT